MDIQLQLAKCADRSEVAHLIYHSTNVWYQQHGLGAIFQSAPEECHLFVDVYQQLDPDYHWLAVIHNSIFLARVFTHEKHIWALGL